MFVRCIGGMSSIVVSEVLPRPKQLTNYGNTNKEQKAVGKLHVCVGIFNVLLYSAILDCGVIDCWLSGIDFYKLCIVLFDSIQMMCDRHWHLCRELVFSSARSQVSDESSGVACSLSPDRCDSWEYCASRLHPVLPLQTFIACKVDGHDYILILSSSKNNVHSIDVGTASSPQTRRSLVMTKEIIDSSIDPHLL